jgi:hypothetical protein
MSSASYHDQSLLAFAVILQRVELPCQASPYSLWRATLHVLPCRLPKTFNRRTSLTRHQSGHTRTAEDVARAVKIALASRPIPNRQSDDYDYSEKGSLSSPSPETKPMSVSPELILPPISAIQGGDYEYRGDNSIHVHGSFSQLSGRYLPAPVRADGNPYAGPSRWQFSSGPSDRYSNPSRHMAQYPNLSSIS